MIIWFQNKLLSFVIIIEQLSNNKKNFLSSLNVSKTSIKAQCNLKASLTRHQFVF